MTNEQKSQIKNYIYNVITDELQNNDNQFKSFKKEMPNYVFPCFRFQFYYNENLNKIYLYYQLDRVSRYVYNYEEIMDHINGRLNSNFYRDINCKLEIINQHKIGDHNSEYLKINTFSYWKCFDGSYKFIEDNQYLKLYQQYWMSSSSMEKEKTFRRKVLEINKKYNLFKDNNNIPKAFNEYAQLYIEYFGKELKEISEDEIYYCYFDCHYNDEIIKEKTRIN